MDISIDVDSVAVQVPQQLSVHSELTLSTPTPISEQRLFQPHSVQVGAVPFALTSVDEVANWLLDLSRRGGGPHPVRLANAYCVALADEDPTYRDLLASSGVNLPDGMPIIWAMRWLPRRHGPLAARPERVRGLSLFERTLELSQTTPTRHYFLGGSQRALDEMLHKIRARYPNTQIAGAHSPPFATMTPHLLDDWTRRIVLAHADLLWVGLGTPKQDYAAQALSGRLGIPCIGVGAAFDFLAGTQPEAPRWMQKTGTEWFFRLMVEPRRLWKRYLFGNPRFIMAVVKGLWPPPNTDRLAGP